MDIFFIILKITFILSPAEAAVLGFAQPVVEVSQERSPEQRVELWSPKRSEGSERIVVTVDNNSHIHRPEVDYDNGHDDDGRDDDGRDGDSRGNDGGYYYLGCLDRLIPPVIFRVKDRKSKYFTELNVKNIVRKKNSLLLVSTKQNISRARILN